MDSANQGQAWKKHLEEYSFRDSGDPNIDLIIFLEENLKQIKQQYSEYIPEDDNLIKDCLNKIKEWRGL